jgi:NF-X1-type zinc finger protein NFXL1
MRAQHRCHFGPCPPCRLPCSTGLACSHTCSAQGCHDEPPPAVPAWEQPKPPKNLAEAAAAAGGSSKRRGGGEAVAAALTEPPAQVAAADAAVLAAGGGTLTPCPPCMAPVSLPCFGGHCCSQMPCHQAAHFPCSAACGRPLPCGHHSCSKPCHVLAPAVASAAAATPGFDPAAAATVAQALPGAAAPCEACERPCRVKRSCCEHPCPARCHPGPCAPCTAPRSQPCHCGKTTLSFECHELQRVQHAASGAGAVAAAAAGALSCGKPCHRALPGCQHPCRAACHPGACAGPDTCVEEVTVRCECRRLKEKWRCSKVRAALEKATGSADFDSGSTSLKLLPCDAECAAQAKAKKRDAPPPAQAAGPTKVAPPAAAAVAEAARPSADAKAAAASAKRMSRAEREAAQAARAAQQLAEERQKKLMAQIGTAGAVVATIALGLLLFSLARRLLGAPAEQEL